MPIRLPSVSEVGEAVIDSSLAHGLIEVDDIGFLDAEFILEELVAAS